MQPSHLRIRLVRHFVLLPVSEVPPFPSMCSYVAPEHLLTRLLPFDSLVFFVQLQRSLFLRASLVEYLSFVTLQYAPLPFPALFSTVQHRPPHHKLVHRLDPTPTRPLVPPARQFAAHALQECFDATLQTLQV